jgi:hypothetical protein
MQSVGLAGQYRQDEETRDFVGMMDALALVPLPRVDDGMALLRNMIPPNLNDLVDYFDMTYVSGTFRRVAQAAANPQQLPALRLVRAPPLYPRDVWNVHQVTLLGADPTNNICEGWNNAFRHLVGHDHPSIFRAIEFLRQDAALATTTILQHQQGHPVATKSSSVQHQNRLRVAANQIALNDFLRSVGHMIRFP